MPWGCPVIASLNQMEHALLVTEPFITSITDLKSLKRILELVEHFGMEKSIIINKYDLNEKMNKKIEKIAKEHNAKVLVEATNRLIPIVDYNHAYREIFEKIVKGLIE